MSDNTQVNNEELKDTVTIAGQEFKIRALSAAKTAGISNIVGKLLLMGKLKLKEFKTLDANDLPTAILFALDEDLLIRFAGLLIGADDEFVRENFDLAWVIEALAIQVRISDLESIARNFSSLVSQIV